MRPICVLRLAVSAGPDRVDTLSMADAYPHTPQYVDPPRGLAPSPPRVDIEITADPIRLLYADGSNWGVWSLNDALHHAHVCNVAVVEVDPQADPPGCQLLSRDRGHLGSQGQPHAGEPVRLYGKGGYDHGVVTIEAARQLGDRFFAHLAPVALDVNPPVYRLLVQEVSATDMAVKTALQRKADHRLSLRLLGLILAVTAAGIGIAHFASSSSGSANSACSALQATAQKENTAAQTFITAGDNAVGAVGARAYANTILDNPTCFSSAQHDNAQQVLGGLQAAGY
jgi:translation initiation factor IF-3